MDLKILGIIQSREMGRVETWKMKLEEVRTESCDFLGQTAHPAVKLQTHGGANHSLIT